MHLLSDENYEVSKEKKSLLCSGLNLMLWILWEKPLIFCLVQQFKQPMLQTRSVQKTSRKTRRTTLQPPAIVCYQEPAIISSLASCVALMTSAPRSSCNYQGAGDTSIIFPIQTSAELQNRESWFTGQLRGWQEPRAGNSIRWGSCCKSNPLLPPSTLSTKLPFMLSVVFTSLQL